MVFAGQWGLVTFTLLGIGGPRCSLELGGLGAAKSFRPLLWWTLDPGPSGLVPPAPAPLLCPTFSRELGEVGYASEVACGSLSPHLSAVTSLGLWLSKPTVNRRHRYWKISEPSVGPRACFQPA